MIGYLTQNHPLISAFARAPVRRTPREAVAARRIFKTAPKLSDYFFAGEIIAAKGPLDRPISGLALDSRRVAPGAVFFALPGRRTTGGGFIDEAISRGAVAIVASGLPAVPAGGVTFIQVADARVALAAVAQRFYKFPDRDLNVVGVTGTRGKTTVAHLLQHLLQGDQRVGLMGSIHCDLGARTVPSSGPAPEALEVFGLLGQMRDAGCRHAVLELNTPDLASPPARGVRYGAVVFTNLTHDASAGPGPGGAEGEPRSRPGSGEPGPVPRVTVVNLDDAPGGELAARLAAEAGATRVVTFGEHAAAQVRAENIVLGRRQSRFRLVWPGGALEIDSPLLGRHNVSNLLAAIATAWGLGRDPLVLLARLRSLPGVPGCLERIEAGQACQVIVDCAHTAETLRHTLGLLRALTPGRLCVVFGCGGRRDRALRPGITRVVQEFADFAVATADNPRTEALAQIFDDMRGGAVAPEKLAWIDDRRRAIGLALDLAGSDDCVLIAGQGHETRQEFADTVFPFDDRQVARELIADRTTAPEN